MRIFAYMSRVSFRFPPLFCVAATKSSAAIPFPSPCIQLFEGGVFLAMLQRHFCKLPPRQTNTLLPLMEFALHHPPPPPKNTSRATLLNISPLPELTYSGGRGACPHSLAPNLRKGGVLCEDMPPQTFALRIELSRTLLKGT